MSSVSQLYFHIKTLNFFGLLCCNYRCDDKWRLSTNYGHKIRALFTLVSVHILIPTMLVCGIVFVDEFHMPKYNRVGNQYFVVQFELSGLLLMVLYYYFYRSRKKNFEFLVMVLRLFDECDCCKVSSSRLYRKYYLVYFVVCSLSSCLYCLIFVQSQMSWYIAMPYAAVFIATIWINGILVLMHFSVVKIMETWMRFLNHQLRTTTSKEVKDLHRILSKRSRLIGITTKEVNRNYGFVLLLIIGFVAATGASGPFYLVSQYYVQRGSQPTWYMVMITFNSLVWDSPMITILLAMSTCDVYNNEVNMGKNL